MSVAFQGKLFSVIQEPTELPDGRVVVMEWVARTDGVRIIARRDDGAILITDEFRRELGRRDFRLPGGKVEGGDAPRLAAEKELREETGYSAREWSFLGTSQPFATVRYALHYFEVRGLEYAPITHDEGEDIEVCWFSAAEVLQMALDGRISEDSSALQLVRLLSRETAR